MLKVLGWVLILSPFIGIFVWASWLAGLMAAIGIFAATGATVAVIGAGVYLANQ